MPALLMMTGKPDQDRKPPAEPAPPPQAPKPRRALLGFRDRKGDTGEAGSGGGGDKGFR